MLTEKHRPVLIVIAGPNGSGKTTITSKILRHEWLENALYVNPDQVAQDRFGDWNSPQAVLQAAQYCEEQRTITGTVLLIFWFFIGMARCRHRAIPMKNPKKPPMSHENAISSVF